jgi:tRNA pseudouridine55 synthase
VAPAHPDGVLLLDKPAGFSSTQALGRSKRLLAARKAGHTGTLDPFATGLLPLVFGEATKFARFLADSAKSYHAVLDLGVTSTTGDTEGTLGARVPLLADERKIDEVLASFVGVRDQIPPMHSAVHHQGRRLYDFAREGVEVERTPRRIEIVALERLALAGSELQVAVTCTKGTYIRTLAMEIGAALGCGAYLTGLRRTAVGPFGVAESVTLAGLEADGVEGARARLLPVEELIRAVPRWDAAADMALRFTQGQVIDCPPAGPGEERAVFDPGGRFLGVGRCEAAGRLAPERLMATHGPAKLPDFA